MGNSPVPKHADFGLDTITRRKLLGTFPTYLAFAERSTLYLGILRAD